MNARAHLQYEWKIKQKRDRLVAFRSMNFKQTKI